MDSRMHSQRQGETQPNSCETADVYDRDKLPTATVVVAGITGAGKSTLVNAVFGKKLAKTDTGRPVTDKMHEYTSPDTPIRIWDTVGLELDAEKTRESINNIKNIIASKSGREDPFDRIHAIWYCINPAGYRYQGAETEFIKELHSAGVPFIIVITQSYDDPDALDAFEQKIRDYNHSVGMGDIEVVQVVAEDKLLRGGLKIDAFGLDKLVDTTMEKLPEFVKSGFAAAQRVSLIQKRAECEKVIFQRVKQAKEGFWDKIPLANILVADKRITNMCTQIAQMYNTNLPEESVQKALRKIHLNAENVIPGLINPINHSYYKKIIAFLSLKEKAGFEVKLGELSKSQRVACMVAYYGYTFMEAMETLWTKYTEEQLKDIDIMCDALLGIVNRILKKRWDKVKTED